MTLKEHFRPEGIIFGCLVSAVVFSVWIHFVDTPPKQEPQKSSATTLREEARIELQSGSQIIVVLNPDGKATIMAGPYFGPLPVVEGRFRLISGTNSIVIEK